MPMFALRALVLSVIGLIISTACSVSLTSPAYSATQQQSDSERFLDAIRNRDSDTATAMLNGPNEHFINARDPETGGTGLHIAVARRDSLWIRFLAQRGVDPDIANNDRLSPILIAAQMDYTDCVEALAENGANVNATDEEGRTPLIIAVQNNNRAMIRHLMRNGADPDQADQTGRSANDYYAEAQSGG